MKKFEIAFYEIRPYALAVIGLYALNSQSIYPMMTFASSILLLGCSATVLYWRHARRIERVISVR